MHHRRSPHLLTRPGLFLLRHPYRSIERFVGFEPRGGRLGPPRGFALIWALGTLPHDTEPEGTYEIVQHRPGGVALILILPPAGRIGGHASIFDIMDRCRPYGVLPHHPGIAPDDVVAVLRRAPRELDVELYDYLSWRGISVSVETRRILRRIFTLSRELRTVNELAKAVFLSRRALGRRFADDGIPVPSHWLHFARVLRACIRLQNSGASLFDIAGTLGYTDGFALSNQMARLTGLRPTDVRDRPGWEWIVECWIEREWNRGGFSAIHHPFLRGRLTDADRTHRRYLNVAEPA